MIKITEQIGNKIWIDTQCGWGYVNSMQRLLNENNGVYNDDTGVFHSNVKFIYLTVHQEYWNGEYCGAKWYYRISRSNTIHQGSTRVPSSFEMQFPSLYNIDKFQIENYNRRKKKTILKICGYYKCNEKIVGRKHKQYCCRTHKQYQKKYRKNIVNKFLTKKN